MGQDAPEVTLPCPTRGTKGISHGHELSQAQPDLAGPPGPQALSAELLLILHHSMGLSRCRT